MSAAIEGAININELSGRPTGSSDVRNDPAALMPLPLRRLLGTRQSKRSCARNDGSSRLCDHLVRWTCLVSGTVNRDGSTGPRKENPYRLVT